MKSCFSRRVSTDLDMPIAKDVLQDLRTLNQCRISVAAGHSGDVRQFGFGVSVYVAGPSMWVSGS